MTAWTAELGGEVLTMLGGGARIVGLVNKLGVNRWYTPYFSPIYKAWKEHQVDVVGLDGPEGIAAALVAKRSQVDRDLRRASENGPQLRTRPSAVEDEVYSLLRGSAYLGWV